MPYSTKLNQLELAWIKFSNVSLPLKMVCKQCMFNGNTCFQCLQQITVHSKDVQTIELLPVFRTYGFYFNNWNYIVGLLVVLSYNSVIKQGTRTFSWRRIYSVILLWLIPNIFFLSRKDLTGRKMVKTVCSHFKHEFHWSQFSILQSNRHCSCFDCFTRIWQMVQMEGFGNITAGIELQLYNQPCVSISTLLLSK